MHDINPLKFTTIAMRKYCAAITFWIAIMRRCKVVAGQSWRRNPLGALTQPATIRRWEEGGNFIFIVIVIDDNDNDNDDRDDEDLMLPICWWLVRAIRAKDAKIKSSARPHTVSYQSWVGGRSKYKYKYKYSKATHYKLSELVGGRSKWESTVFSVFPQFDGSIKYRTSSSEYLFLLRSHTTGLSVLYL